MTRFLREAAFVAVFLSVGLLGPRLLESPGAPARRTAAPAQAAPVESPPDPLAPAREHLRAGRAHDAVRLLDALPARSREGERLLGVALVRAERYAEGRVVLEALGRARDADAETALCLARALLRTGAVLDAISLLGALSTDPRATAETHAELARALLVPGTSAYSPAEAVRWSEAAVQHGSPAYDVLARAYAEAGDPLAAQAVVDACLADDGCSPDVRAECLAVVTRAQ